MITAGGSSDPSGHFPPRKFSRTYCTVSLSVSPGSRETNPSSRLALFELKYQKYSAISTSSACTGEVKFHWRKSESMTWAPATANFEGKARRGEATFVNRSSRSKSFTKVQLTAP